jgi:hypothetical protein
MKKLFKFTINYFRADGLFHMKTNVKWKIREKNDRPNMQDVVAKLRGLQRNGGQKGMPGGIDEGFIGYVLVIPEIGYPRITDFTKVKNKVKE